MDVAESPFAGSAWTIRRASGSAAIASTCSTAGQNGGLIERHIALGAHRRAQPSPAAEAGSEFTMGAKMKLSRNRC